MKSLTRPSFWLAYDALDSRVREAARKAYGRFAQDPGHPSLRFKKLAGYAIRWPRHPARKVLLASSRPDFWKAVMSNGLSILEV